MEAQTNSTEQGTNELNGTNKQIPMLVNMDTTPDGNVIVSCSVGLLSHSIVIPSAMMDDFIAKRLAEKRLIKQVLNNPKRTVH